MYDILRIEFLGHQISKNETAILLQQNDQEETDLGHRG